MRWCLATGGYSNVYYLSTNAKGCNATAVWRAHKRGALLRQSVLRADSPDVHSAVRRAPVEADVDERVAAQRRAHLGAARPRTITGRPRRFPKPNAGTTWRSDIPAFGNLVPRDIASRAAKAVVDDGYGVGELKNGVYLDFAYGHPAAGRRRDPRPVWQPVRHVREHHGREPVRSADAHLPGAALHDGRAVGGLRPDEHDSGAVRDRGGEFLRSRGEPAGRERADAGSGRRLFRIAVHVGELSLRACLRMGWTQSHEAFAAAEQAVHDKVARLMSVNGDRTVDSFHRELGQIMWDYCGMERSAESLTKALELIPPLREEFWRNVRVPGSAEDLNQSLEMAGGWRTSWSWPSCCASMRSTATSRVGRISGPSTRRRTARRCAMTSTMRMWLRGSTRVKRSRRRCTRSRWRSSMFALSQRSYK